MSLRPPRLALLISVMALVSGCSKDGDTTIINQDVVPADPIAKEWRIPEMLSTANAGSASTGEIQIDAAGNGLALFIQDGIWSRRWTASGGWEPMERVSDIASPWGRNPRLAMDSAGNAMVVFDQLDDPSGSTYSAWWNRYAVGSGWGVPALLETDDLSTAGDVRVAVDPAGNAIAVWATYDGADSNLQFNRYVVGSGWAGPAPLEDGPDSAFAPRVGLDASGAATAIWGQDTAGVAPYDILSSQYVPGTGWTTPVPLDSGDEFVSTPEIAVNAAGAALAVWTQFDGLLSNLWAAAYTPAGGWGPATLVESDDTFSSLSPQVGIDSTGAGTAVWSNDDGFYGRLQSGRYTPGSGWSSVGPLGVLMNGFSHRLAVHRSGTTGVVWSHRDGQFANVLYSSHEGGPWSSPVFVEFVGLETQSPALALDTAGNALAIWSSYDSVGGFRTWGNRYD